MCVRTRPRTHHSSTVPCLHTHFTGHVTPTPLTHSPHRSFVCYARMHVQEEVDDEGRQGRLAVGTRSGAVAVFNVESGVDTRLGSRHSGAITALAWDGDALFSGGQDKVA
jgi:WD40 repeat protein